MGLVEGPGGCCGSAFLRCHHGDPAGATSKPRMRLEPQFGDRIRLGVLIEEIHLSGRPGTGVDREDRAPPQARAGSRGGLLRPGSVPVQQLRQRRAAGISGGPADPDRQTAASAGRPRPAPAHRFGPHQSPPPDATAGHSTCPDSGIPHPHSPQRVRQQADGPSRKVEVNGPLTEPLRAGTEPLPDVIGFSVPHDATAI